jgi:uncharacterized protein (DUF427 family)
MSYVFISYAHADSEEVERIVSKLEANGIKVWIDRESIHVGRQWRKEIVEGIDNASAFLIHISAASTASINVLKELNLAEEAIDPFVIPIMLENVKLPSQMRYQLAGVQQILYFENAERGFQQLEHQIVGHQDHDHDEDHLIHNHEQMHQMAEKSVPRPSLREIEVVIKDGSLATFTEAVKAKLLQNLAKISMGAVSDYVITRVVEGSLHVFVQMPLDDSYELQAQALNRDPRLLAAGISAIRFKPQGAYIVEGEFSSTPDSQPVSQPAAPTTQPAAEAKAVPAASKKPRFWQFTKTLFKVLIYLVVLAFAVNGLLCFLNAFFPQFNFPSLGMLSPAVTPTLLAANPNPTDLPEATETHSPSLTYTQTQVPYTSTPIPTETVTPTVTPSETPTSSSTPTASPSPTITPSPTDESLLATSNSQAYCRYGPSTAYLSYADIFVGDQVELEGRYQYGGWIWVKPVGKNASCWISGSLLDTPFDLGELPVIDYKVSMIFSPDVDPPTNVTTVRNGSTVTISWDPINVGPADFRGYLLDAFVCQNGSYIKYLDDIQTTSIVITDELTGCPAASSGTLYGVHVRGYTDPVKIVWP